MENLAKDNPQEIILDNLNIEQHAKSALLTANALAAEEPINAADLLRAIIIINRSGTTSSDCQSELAESSLQPI